MLRTARGALVEYGTSVPPLALVFEFNPQRLSRSRTITVKTGGAPGARGGYDFLSPSETPRVSQGVVAQPEAFTLEVLLDATDRMSRGDPVASTLGVQPEVDTLCAMAEPRSQGPGGLQALASLGFGEERAFRRSESAPVLLFVWGRRVLPVFLTAVQIDEQAHLPSLLPYRATASLTLQVIEGRNPFHLTEKVRQLAYAALTATQGVGRALEGIL